MSRTVRCPDSADAKGIVGCGRMFTAEPDDEGLFDCPHCGLFFDAGHPHSQPQPVAQDLYDALNPFDQWCVRSNLRRVQEGEVTAEQNVAVLRANGYSRLADVAEAVYHNLGLTTADSRGKLCP